MSFSAITMGHSGMRNTDRDTCLARQTSERESSVLTLLMMSSSSCDFLLKVLQVD